MKRIALIITTLALLAAPAHAAAPKPSCDARCQSIHAQMQMLANQKPCQKDKP